MPRCLWRLVELERAFDRRHPLIIGMADDADQATAVGERRPRGQIRVRELRGDPGRVEQRVAVLRLTGQALRFAEADQRLAPHSGVVRPEQLERVTELLGGLARR